MLADSFYKNNYSLMKSLTHAILLVYRVICILNRAEVALVINLYHYELLLWGQSVSDIL